MATRVVSKINRGRISTAVTPICPSNKHSHFHRRSNSSCHLRAVFPNPKSQEATTSHLLARSVSSNKYHDIPRSFHESRVVVLGRQSRRGVVACNAAAETSSDKELAEPSDVEAAELRQQWDSVKVQAEHFLAKTFAPKLEQERESLKYNMHIDKY